MHFSARLCYWARYIAKGRSICLSVCVPHVLALPRRLSRGSCMSFMSVLQCTYLDATFPEELSFYGRTYGTVKFQRLKDTQVIYTHVNACRVRALSTAIALYRSVIWFSTTHCARKTHAHTIHLCKVKTIQFSLQCKCGNVGCVLYRPLYRVNMSD